MRAILSDIHGNLEALQAVLADIRSQGITEIYNLGDTFGYGPNPLECLDLAMQMSVNLLGRFDYGVLHGVEDFCEASARSILWGKSQLKTLGDGPVPQRRLKFLFSLESSHREGDVLYVHGSPRNPPNEYVIPEDIYNPVKMAKIWAKFDRLCFAGHTHVPGILTTLETGAWEFLSPDQFEGGYPVEGKKLICNVGSVGQPHDLDERACYALFDGETIRIRRVPYDIETTVAKIYAEPELANFLGDRLREGR